MKLRMSPRQPGRLIAFDQGLFYAYDDRRKLHITTPRIGDRLNRVPVAFEQQRLLRALEEALIRHGLYQRDNVVLLLPGRPSHTSAARAFYARNAAYIDQIRVKHGY